MPQRYRAIFESPVDFAIIATDRDGLVTDWNRGAERVLGWSAEEMLGQSAERFFTPEDQAGGRPRVEMALALSQGRADDERWHLRKDGSRFWAAGEMSALRNDAGEHLGFLKILTDRTAEREAQAALLKTEANLLRAQEAGGVGLFSLDIVSNTLRVTPEFCRQFGLPAREIYPAAEIEALLVCDDVGVESSTTESRRDGSFKLDAQYRIRRGDTGEVRWISRKAEIERDEAGAPVRVVGAVRDITERQQVEEQLRELNATLAARTAELAQLNVTLEARVAERTAERDRMWEASPDLLLMIDFAGVFLRVNPAWTTVLGYAPDELVGHHVNEFVLVDDHGETTHAYELAAEGGLPRLVNRYRHKDGSTRWVAWTAAPADDVTYATGRDVTEERRQQAELARAQEALRQSQKMEAVGQLTGGLAHDFNNLLAGISGSLELMGRRVEQGRVDQVGRYLTAAQEASRRAAALTHRLLAFSRRQTLDPKATDVNRLVAEMEDLVQRTVGPAIEVETQLAPDLWSTLVDPHQLENALLNLCINARDAMPDGGRLVVETANAALTERVARSHDLPPGEYVSLCVRDNGTGMSPEVVERAFEPFFTTKPIGQGTGLGLSMIYGFARQSGGQVRIHSEVGRGTTVCLHLPRHDAPEAVEAAEAAASAGGAQAGFVPTSRTVLVVDDEPTVRMIVVDAVEDLGLCAVEASTGPEALDVLRSTAGIDLLVTDVGLPGGLNGRQVADAARVLHPGLPVLFITGYAEAAILSYGHLEPGMQIVTKPFDMTTLIQRVQEMIAAAP